MKPNVIPRRLHPSDIVDPYKHNLFIRFNCQSLQEAPLRSSWLAASRQLLSREFCPRTSNSRGRHIQRGFEALSIEWLYEKVDGSRSKRRHCRGIVGGDDGYRRRLDFHSLPAWGSPNRWCVYI